MITLGHTASIVFVSKKSHEMTAKDVRLTDCIHARTRIGHPSCTGLSTNAYTQDY